MLQESTITRNALARAQRDLSLGKIPVKKDIAILEELETAEANKILDEIEELQQKKLHQQTSQKSIAVSPPLTSNSRNNFNTQQDFEGPGLSGAGSNVQPPERKKVLSGREKDYFQFFERRFGPLIVLILYFAMADLEKAVFYAPSPSECKELAPHLARIGPKAEDLLHLPKWAHEAIVTSDSTFTVGMVLAGYLDRIGVLEKLLPWMTSWVERSRKLSEQQTKPETSTGNISSNGAGGGVDQQYPTLDQLGVTGIGLQDRAEA